MGNRFIDTQSKRSYLSESVGGQKFLHLPDKIRRFVSVCQSLEKSLEVRRSAHREMTEQKQVLQNEIVGLEKKIAMFESERAKTDRRVSVLINELENLHAGEE